MQLRHEIANKDFWLLLPTVRTGRQAVFRLGLAERQQSRKGKSLTYALLA